MYIRYIEKTTIITARNLLLTFLDLRRFVPDVNRWNEKSLSWSPSSHFRFQQLVAMFNAFEIEWNPEAFVNGEFIKYDDPRYASLLDTLHTSMLEMLPVDMRESINYGHGFGVHSDQLTDCFNILFKYRERVGSILTFSDGVLAASGLYLFAHQKTDELNRIVRENLGIIDDILVAIISPEEKQFSMVQMVNDYGYPDVDLCKIDFEDL